MIRTVTARRATAALALTLVATGPLGACSDDDGSAEELCELVGDGRSFAGLFADGLDPTDTERALAQLRSAQVDLSELRAAAPSEVQDDLDEEAAYVDALLEVIETVDPDDPAAVVEGVNALDEQREAADVAALELTRFQEAECGVTTVP